MSQGIAFKSACVPSKDSDQPVQLQSDQSFQGTPGVAKDPKHLQVDSEDWEACAVV